MKTTTNNYTNSSATISQQELLNLSPSIKPNKTLKPSSTIFKANQPTNHKNLPHQRPTFQPTSKGQKEAPKPTIRPKQKGRNGLGKWCWIFSICHEKTGG
jgi:hypothetical protein